MLLKREVIGTKYFGPTIDVTDPCYDKGVWCRMNEIEIVPGTYTCIAWVDLNDGRVMKAEIRLDDDVNQLQCEEIGSIGVDAGLAGFFNNKPNYNGAEWREICEMLGEPDENGVLKNAWITKDGFFTSSGYGDGCYPVFARKTAKGEIKALEVIFYG